MRVSHSSTVQLSNPGLGPGTDADRERPDVSGYRGNVGQGQRIPDGTRAAHMPVGSRAADVRERRDQRSGSSPSSKLRPVIWSAVISM